MVDDSGIPALAAELSQSMVLLRATHEFYQSILVALSENTDTNGTPDLPELFQQLNTALTSFAPRDIEIRSLLSRLES
jgi:hypothetical protein